EEWQDLGGGEVERQMPPDVAGCGALGQARGFERAHDLGEGGGDLPGVLPGDAGVLCGWMTMCTRWSVPDCVAACTRCARMLYTSRGPEISLMPSVSQASSESRTVPSFTS